jgi:hypothetical protein
MSLHRGFVTAGYVITVIDSVPYWLPAFAIVAAVIAWATRRRGRDGFQDSAAEAARAPLPQRTGPMRDDRPGVDDQALATCIAILRTRRAKYAKAKGGRR